MIHEFAPIRFEIDEEEIKRSAIAEARERVVEQILSRTRGAEYNLSTFAAEYMTDCTNKIIEKHADKIIEEAARRVARGVERSPVWSEWLDRCRCGLNNYTPTDKAVNDLVKIKKKYGSIPAFSDVIKAIDAVAEKAKDEESNNAE